MKFTQCQPQADEQNGEGKHYPPPAPREGLCGGDQGWKHGDKKWYVDRQKMYDEYQACTQEEKQPHPRMVVGLGVEWGA